MLNPYSLDAAFRRASRCIDASVVVGGSLFEDPAAYRELLNAGIRGVKVRLLFPSPRSRWLEAFTRDAQIDLSWYGHKILNHARGASQNVEGLELRWYEAPGPCWFVVIDNSSLFTKPITASDLTWPIQDHRPDSIAHFVQLFDQIWSVAKADFRQSRAPVAPRVQLIGVGDVILGALAEDPSRLHRLTPEAFELFVAERLSAMGLGVKRVGASNARDGGIDILAWPEQNAAFPFLLAVQVKHRRQRASLGPGPIRELRGVLTSHPIDAGLIVTNTTFTPRSLSTRMRQSGHEFSEEAPTQSLGWRAG